MKVIEFKDVSFSYGNEAFAIKKLNFSVEEGEFVDFLSLNV